MTKKEADIIVTACKKYNLYAIISKVVDDYSVRLENRIEFRSFPAAKLAVNALVIEKRTKTGEKAENLPPPDDTSFLKSRYHYHKIKDKSAGNWGENRSLNNNSAENKADK